MVELTDQPIDLAAVLARAGSRQAGAVVLFVGTAREMTGGRRTASLDYECYPQMAAAKLAELEVEARRRWPVIECVLVHRLGHLEVGEASVAVAVSTPHRHDAFEAASWLIDTLKKVVPIWKKENWADGTVEWVHPGLEAPHACAPADPGAQRPAAAKKKRDTVKRTGPIVDRFGRVHTDLRISVTDRCNIRCFYCMPAENVQFRPRAEILTFEEIERFVRVVARLGIKSLRLTGGEPFVRNSLDRLVARLARIPGIEDLALSTNGILLPEQAPALRAAGLDRLNVSLDTLDAEKFSQITRRDAFERVLAGLFAAQRAGFERIKINAVAIRGLTEEDAVPLARFARDHGFELRFIEYMPLDADHAWEQDKVLSGDEIRRLIEQELGPLVALPVVDPSQPATDYRFAEGVGRIGFINPVTQPFCERCDRLRLTADGKVRNCLFSLAEWDARALLRSDASDDELAELVREAVDAKRAAHGINSDDFIQPERAMYQIGG